MTNDTSTVSTDPLRSQRERACWMSLLAKAPAPLLLRVASDFGALPPYLWLRQPEIGLAMVRGRSGGTGEQFNLGEMSVTRCALRLSDGVMGVAYVAGRDRRHAELAALFDAMLQSDAAERVQQLVLQPIAAALAEQRAHSAAAAQETRVEFMTMVRGEAA